MLRWTKNEDDKGLKWKAVYVGFMACKVDHLWYVEGSSLFTRVCKFIECKQVQSP